MFSKAVMVLAALLLAFSPLVTAFQDMELVPLCRALEILKPGDQIPVAISGIYAVDYLYDPDEPVCQLDVTPQTCVEFAPGAAAPGEFNTLAQADGRVSVVFYGVLYGPAAVVQPPFAETVSVAHRALARNSRKLYCGDRYGTKLVVYSVVSYRPVPASVPWPVQRAVEPAAPPPIQMALPEYPPIARNIDYEGVVLIAVEVTHGEVTKAKVQFGDSVLIAEAIDNVRSWRFGPDVSATFTVMYDFSLDRRADLEEDGVSLEMRLPLYLRVTGQRRKF